jgi:hypothetical protein
VIADGQPCFKDRPSTTCDAFASCVNGACARAGAVTCP